jgi:hypothetical protein
MKRLFLALVLAAATLSTQALATNLVWTSPMTIEEFYPSSSGLFLEMSELNLNPANECPDKLTVSLDPENPQKYEVYVATLLSAFLAGKSVQLVIDLDDTTCGTEINRFQVLR